MPFHTRVAWRSLVPVSLLAVLLVATVGIVLLASVVGGVRAQPATRFAVIPQPVTIEPAGGGAFTITAGTVIAVPPGSPDVERIGRGLAALLGQPEVRVGAGAPEGSIVLALDTSDASLGEEGYALTVTPGAVRVAARTPAGVFYGVQTLRQLLPGTSEFAAARPRPLSVPAVRIVDRPRFAWRGAMLDVARHFFGPADVKRYVDLLALYKINRLHLHLSDDQGWRIEIRSWPNLARHGGSTAVGGGPGGFYTQAEYSAIVDYARERFVTIVPEIDMPGHTNAALAAYPELNCDGVAPALYTGIEVGFSALCVEKDVTYRFIDDVVREIAGLTPGAWFHMGGDEVKRLTPEAYRRFIERVQAIVASHGKEAIGWDEIAPVALAPTTVVQHWRPTVSPELAAAKRIIVSPADRVYLDMKYDEATVPGLNWAGLVSVEHAYAWDPATLLEGVDESAILGVEAPIWSETLATMSDVEYMAFPRLPGVAEIGWSPASARRWDEYRVRLAAHGPRWSALGVNAWRAPEIDWRP